MSPARLDEESLETLVVRQMVAGGWIQGVASDFNPSYALDLRHLSSFLQATQPQVADALGLGADSWEHDSPTRAAFLAKLQGEITRHGVVHVLRRGFGHKSVAHVDFSYPLPTPGNDTATALFEANRWSVTRQVHYSPSDALKSIDLVAFLNGLPVATFELKNSITKQTVADAVEQYQTQRDPRELLFAPRRCAVHFALDDQRVKFCAELAGQKSWFLPFDQGYDDGAGNPLNRDGVMTDYLWRQVLAPSSLANILENYARVVVEKNPKTGRSTQKAIWPRFHQLDGVRRLLADVRLNGAGQRYLIQHSAGSGKSNSIAWLAHQLVEVQHAGASAFDSVLVVTDRTNLDGQTYRTITSFAEVRSTVKHADTASDLRSAIEAGKRIIVTTVQKFPYIVAALGDEHRGRRFAVIIDEAHSSQSGKAAAALAGAVSADVATKFPARSQTAVMSPGSDDADVTVAEEQKVTAEDELLRLALSKRLPSNASYFAFTATPKDKTLETFGTPIAGVVPQGEKRSRPFHSYTMKQAIQEGFILDVLAGYVPIDSYYKLVATVEDDPQFDAKKAGKKLRGYVEGHQTAIRRKAEIMVDHFHTQVIGRRKIGGQARAMVITGSIDRAIDYFEAIRDYLVERGSPYKAVVAFSDVERDEKKVTEADYNGFPGRQIPEKLKDDPYRILVAADKYQTGYDEPLLHTMYVDKPLAGVLAVQTLSRLNRARPGKTDTAVLDFFNDAESIQKSFENYYRTTLLIGETDPDKLHDLAADLLRTGVYVPEHVDQFVALFLSDTSRERLDPILDRCAAEYVETLDDDEQIDFKAKAKAFVRTYSFLALILPFTNTGWEKLSIFLSALVPKLPAPAETDLSAGILETVDMDSYRIEKREAMSITLADQEAEVAPVPASGGRAPVEPELARLSEILNQFNDLYGGIAWEDSDRIRDRIAVEIPERVLADADYANARANNDAGNAKLALERAMTKAMLGYLRDETQLFKQWSDNPDFKAWLTDAVFRTTYGKDAA